MNRAVGIYLVSGREVWLSQKVANHPLYPLYWFGPGGTVEEGEKYINAAKRELSEETGFNTRGIKLRFLERPLIRYHANGEMYSGRVYLLETEEVPQNTEPRKQQEWKRIDLGSCLPEPMLRGVRDDLLHVCEILGIRPYDYTPNPQLPHLDYVPRTGHVSGAPIKSIYRDPDLLRNQ